MIADDSHVGVTFLERVHDTREGTVLIQVERHFDLDYMLHVELAHRFACTDVQPNQRLRQQNSNDSVDVSFVRNWNSAESDVANLN